MLQPIISKLSTHPRAPAGLPLSPPPLHSLSRRIQAVFRAAISNLLHFGVSSRLKRHAQFLMTIAVTAFLLVLTGL